MDGGKFQQLVGSRRQVFNGTAKKTNYGKNGLEKKDLKMNKHGLIVSAKKSKTAKKSKHLGKFLQKKGSKTFGPRKTAKKSKGGQYAGDHCEALQKEADDLKEQKDALQEGDEKNALQERYSEARKKADECEAQHTFDERHNEGEDMPPVAPPTDPSQEEPEPEMGGGKKKKKSKSKKH